MVNDKKRRNIPWCDCAPLNFAMYRHNTLGTVHPTDLYSTGVSRCSTKMVDLYTANVSRD